MNCTSDKYQDLGWRMRMELSDSIYEPTFEDYIRVAEKHIDEILGIYFSNGFFRVDTPDYNSARQQPLFVNYKGDMNEV